MLSTASELGMEVPALQSLEMLLAVKKD
jgi:hypothetical protein